MIKRIITNDEYYLHLEDNPELLAKAGWFDDNQTIEERIFQYKLDLMCTPFYKLKKPKSNNPIVLLSTGGFSPLHLGHLSMMDIAFDELTKKGFNVVGGYFSPSHDSYVLNKHKKTFNIEYRIKSTEELIFSNERYLTCPWEAVYNKSAINFTDCIERLKLYLRKYYHPRTEICYVFGGDNQFFMQAFKNKGMCFCVKREGELSKENYELIDNKRIFYSSSNTYKNISSRELNYEIKEKEGLFLIREDSDFSDKLKPIFEKYFKNVKIIPKNYKDIKTNYRTISLDVHFKGDYNLSITRLFNFGNHFKSNKLISRDNLSIEEQIKLIPKGEYSLVDDDISSGFTVNYIKELLLKEGVLIKEEISLMNTIYKNNVLDVVDLRDFVFGEEFGGLTVELPNKKIARIPYLFPLVDLNFRASFSYKDGIEFSKEIIHLNKLIHKETKIKELPELQRELFYFYNFTDDNFLINSLDIIFCV